MSKKAIFLDRDGVINRKMPEHDYVKSWKEFEILPTVPKAIKYLKDREWLVIVITNQRGVARKIMSEETVNDIHRRINILLKKYDTQIDAFYWCKHGDEDNCNCRKPSPGLILSAIKDFKLDKNNCLFIGDTEIDAKCGFNAGIKTKIIPTDSALFLLIKDIIKE